MSSSPLLIQAQNADVPYIMQVRECAEVAGRTGNDILAAALYRAEEFYLIPGQRWLFFSCSDRNGKKI